MRVALIFAAIDGILSMQTGVGAVVNGHIRDVLHMLQSGEFNGTSSVSLFCFTPLLRSDGEFFERDLFDLAERTCRLTGGNIIFLESFARGGSWRDFYDGGRNGSHLEQWDRLSRSAAHEAMQLASEFDQVVVICHDFFFVSVSTFISGRNLRVVWIPHTDPLKVLDSDQEHLWINSIRSLSLRGDRIGFIGSSVGEALVRAFDVSPSVLIPIPNTEHLTKQSEVPSDAFRRQLFEEYAIPLEKNLIFLFGRLHPDKGFDRVLPGVKHFLESRSSKSFHAVVLCPTATSDNSYLGLVDSMLLALADRATVIRRFVRNLPQAILTYSRLFAVICPSRTEAMPLSALEALYHTRAGVMIFYSDIAPHREIFAGHRNCWALEEFSETGVCNALNRLTTYVPSHDYERRLPQMSDKGFCDVLRDILANCEME